jgi:pimeloyl-ACP methyl ester carboxylesterase
MPTPSSTRITRRAERALALAALLASVAGCAVLDRNIAPWQEYAAARPAPAVALNAEDRGRGRPVLLIHGFGNSIYVWRNVAPALEGSCRVVAVDLKGFGRSPKPEDGHYSVYDQAALIRDFVIARDLRDVTLVGHSFGGGAALVATLFLQEAAPGRQARLVLIDSIAYPQELPFFIRVLATPVLGPVMTRLIPAQTQVRSVLKEVYFDDAAVPEDAVRAYAEGLETAEGRCATVQTARQILPPDLEDLARRYPTIKVPTLIVWGRHDTIVPLAVGERLRDAIPGARLEVIEDSGHSPQEERPQSLMPLLRDFLGCD